MDNYLIDNETVIEKTKETGEMQSAGYQRYQAYAALLDKYEDRKENRKNG